MCQQSDTCAYRHIFYMVIGFDPRISLNCMRSLNPVVDGNCEVTLHSMNKICKSVCQPVNAHCTDIKIQHIQ